MKFSRSSSVRGITIDEKLDWVKHVHCYCKPSQVAAIMVSETAKNPRRLFYKCRSCDFFAWVKEEDVIRSGEELEVEQSPIVLLNEKVDGLVNYIKGIVKIGLIMYFIMLVIVANRN